MKVSVEPVVGNALTDLITFATGAAMDARATEIMTLCQKMSGEIWSGYIDKKLVCCWGLIPPSVFSNVAYLWMYNTCELKEQQFVFIRRSQIEVEKMLKHYDKIIGHCMVGNDKAVRWLKWLGAEFDPPQDGMRKFSIRKHSHG